MKIKVLFVCLGNICRSPMAEYIFKDLLEKEGIKDCFVVASAATSDEECYNGIGNPPSRGAQEELKKHGIGKTEYTDFTKKRAHQITLDDYNEFEFILCAEKRNISNAERLLGGDRDNKLRLMLDFEDEKSPLKGKDISAPWFTHNYVDAYNDIYAGCKSFLKYLKENNRI